MRISRKHQYFVVIVCGLGGGLQEGAQAYTIAYCHLVSYRVELLFRTHWWWMQPVPALQFAFVRLDRSSRLLLRHTFLYVLGNVFVDTVVACSASVAVSAAAARLVAAKDLRGDAHAFADCGDHGLIEVGR